MLIGRKSRAAEEMDTALADYPVLNLKKKKKSLRYRSEGRAVVAHGYLRQVFGNGQYLADIPMELRWEPNRLTLLLDLCPCDFIRSMSLPRSVLSMSARLAYNLKARKSQILEGTRDNGYLRRLRAGSHRPHRPQTVRARAGRTARRNHRPPPRRAGRLLRPDPRVGAEKTLGRCPKPCQGASFEEAPWIPRTRLQGWGG